jgi:acylaminoacyl-peptidase
MNTGSAAEPIALAEFAKLPAYSNVKISPTGDYLAATVRNDDGESSLVVLDMEDNQITAIARGFGRDFITNFIWANDERVVAWVGRKFGSRDAPSATDNVVAMNWDGSKKEWIYGRGKNENLAYDRSYRVAQYLHRLPEDDEHILIAVNDFSKANGSFTEALKLDIYSGRTRRVTRAPMRGAQLVADNDGAIRLSVGADPDNENAITIHRRDDKRWSLIGQYKSKEGSLTPVGFTPGNNYVYVLDDRETDTTSLYLYDPEKGHHDLLYGHGVVDIEDVEQAPDGKVIGVYTEPDYPDFEILDPEHEISLWLQAVQVALRGYRVTPTSATEDGRLAIIRADSDRLPARYYLLKTDTMQLSQIVSVLPGIDEQKMRPTDAYKLEVRDGTTVYAYLTQPDDTDGPFPMVVMPHGGPHGVRDYWRYDPDVQMLASRGYAVLQINFRGSGGYGRSFLHEGYGKWGTLMQDDVTDATQWAIKQGLADPKRVCIYGASYGGYAAMMGGVREPDLYKCVIAYVGVYDLELMFEKGDIPRREAGIVYLKQAVGTDKDDLRARSPIHNLDKLKAPVFIVHGGEDFRVDVEHAYRLRDKLEELGKPYEWMLKEKEAHGFYRPENRLELYERMLAFLNTNIGPNSAVVTE